MPITQLSLAVVGADFPNKRGPTRRFAIQLCRPGDRVLLVPEPKNRADSRAVQVMSVEGVVMGYLSAERCGWIGSMISAGRELRAVFQMQTQFGAVIRVAFDGEDPVIPPPSVRESAPEETPEWWPDDIPPDE